MSALSRPSRTDTQGHRPTPDHPTRDHPTRDHPTRDHPTREHPTPDHPTPDHPTGKRPAASESSGGPTGSEAAVLLTPVVLSETERRFRFRGLPQAIGAARRALREWEGYFEPDRFYDLSLCVSELVTSRVHHSGEGEIELAVRRAPGLVRAEVSDPREDAAAAVAQAPLTAPADWGMFIIDHVADRWGVDRSLGTRVWCEIDLASSAT